MAPTHPQHWLTIHLFTVNSIPPPDHSIIKTSKDRHSLPPMITVATTEPFGKLQCAAIGLGTSEVGLLFHFLMRASYCLANP
mmetsp:Transcript_45343/g.96471  ORF Transcript_45343/g.96471 Transcript_45343/m.96471 type:complete len:82 (-) Transcript_45343:567-812(-)